MKREKGGSDEGGRECVLEGEALKNIRREAALR